MIIVISAASSSSCVPYVVRQRKSPLSAHSFLFDRLVQFDHLLTVTDSVRCSCLPDLLHSD